MTPCLALFAARFRVLLQYRAAAWAGVITQVVFGLLIVSIRGAFYRNASSTPPLPYDQMVTYTWLGQALFAMAKRENAFFSSTVRIQTERGHLTCDSGPYRVVRHPGYLGMLMSLIAFPLVLNSYWAFLPAGMSAILLVARTVLEDRFLTESLPGYADFTRKTRRMLVPGLF